MLIVQHRVNTIAELRRVPPGLGVEIDVRDYDGKLRLAHDPYDPGEPLDAWLEACGERFVIFNLKCDGLARELFERIARSQVRDYFLLDLAAPTLVTLTRGGVRRVAVRYSEFEAIEGALAFAGRAEWVWVDCFTHLPLDPVSYSRLREHFKICIVSPELQGHGREAIAAYRRQLREMPVDAVCTDCPDDWRGPAIA